MPRRFERKCKYLRGMRRHGHGNIKNRRGAGNRGGKGGAGLHKHRWTYITAKDTNHFGKKGFVNPTSKRLPILNIWDIANMIRKNELAKEGDYYVLEFDGKLLGTGEIDVPVIVRAKAVSEKAKAKIEKAGGKVELV